MDKRERCLVRRGEVQVGGVSESNLEASGRVHLNLNQSFERRIFFYLGWGPNSVVPCSSGIYTGLGSARPHHLVGWVSLGKSLPLLEPQFSNFPEWRLVMRDAQ